MKLIPRLLVGSLALGTAAATTLAGSDRNGPVRYAQVKENITEQCPDAEYSNYQARLREAEASSIGSRYTQETRAKIAKINSAHGGACKKRELLGEAQQACDRISAGFFPNRTAIAWTVADVGKQTGLKLYCLHGVLQHQPFDPDEAL